MEILQRRDESLNHPSPLFPFLVPILSLVSWRCGLLPFGKRVFVLENGGDWTSRRWDLESAFSVAGLHCTVSQNGLRCKSTRTAPVFPAAENGRECWSERRRLYSSSEYAFNGPASLVRSGNPSGVNSCCLRHAGESVSSRLRYLDFRGGAQRMPLLPTELLNKWGGLWRGDGGQSVLTTREGPWVKGAGAAMSRG